MQIPCVSMLSQLLCWSSFHFVTRVVRMNGSVHRCHSGVRGLDRVAKGRLPCSIPRHDGSRNSYNDCSHRHESPSSASLLQYHLSITLVSATSLVLDIISPGHDISQHVTGFTYGVMALVNGTKDERMPGQCRSRKGDGKATTDSLQRNGDANKEL